MTKVVKITKIGKDAETSTDPNDFIFHSLYNTFKILSEGTKNVVLAASTNNQSFIQSHGLGFIPLLTAFAKESSNATVFAPNTGFVTGFGIKAGIIYSGIKFNYVSADITHITFNFDNTIASTKNIAIRFFILEKVTN